MAETARRRAWRQWRVGVPEWRKEEGVGSPLTRQFLPPRAQCRTAFTSSDKRRICDSPPICAVRLNARFCVLGHGGASCLRCSRDRIVRTTLLSTSFRRRRLIRCDSEPTDSLLSLGPTTVPFQEVSAPLGVFSDTELPLDSDVMMWLSRESIRRAILRSCSLLMCMCAPHESKQLITCNQSQPEQ